MWQVCLDFKKVADVTQSPVHIIFFNEPKAYGFLAQCCILVIVTAKTMALKLIFCDAKNLWDLDL